MVIDNKALKSAFESRKRLLESGKLKKRTPVERARSNPKSLRLAINGKCWDCQGGYADPNPQWRIGNCVCPDCSLYPVRPYRKFEGRDPPKSVT